jgi:cobalamin biosynthesis protein CobT
MDEGMLRYYTPDRGPMARRLKAAFVLRPAKPEYSDRLLRSGQVDDEELWRWGAGDFRVFEQKIRESVPDTDITLLVDESGSMGGADRMPVAKRLAQLMLDCLSTMDGVTLRVRGHTGQSGDFPLGMVIDKIWDPGDDPNRIALLEANAQNMDGHAIDWCVKELLSGRGNTQKILIVIADGEPYAHGYSGYGAEQHVRDVVTKAERNGVYVIQLGVSSDLDYASQQRMFNHFIPFTTDENLLRDLAKLMAKLF